MNKVVGCIFNLIETVCDLLLVIKMFQKFVDARDDALTHPLFYFFSVVFVVFQLIADVCARYAGDSSKLAIKLLYPIQTSQSKLL